MSFSRIGRILLVLLCVLIPFSSFAAETQTTITPQASVIYVHEGKAANIRVKISPRMARSKGVTYESDNEAIATVNKSGKVSGIAAGSCNVIVTSKYDPTVSVKVPVSVIVPVKKITLATGEATVRVGDTVPIIASYEPGNASIQEVTYRSSNNRIAAVDENGVVTGVKAGKTSIVATAVDGSKVRGKVTVTVVQQVTGVSFKTPHVRVGASNYGTFTAVLEPKKVTNKHMTWETDDAGIATVSGQTNRVRIQGHHWGQATITGTTEDGGYQVQFVADIGSLRHAVRVRRLSVRDGKPYITLQNMSDMDISEVRYLIKGYDSQGKQIQMSRKQDTLSGTYDYPLTPGEETTHGQFNFIGKIDYYDLAYYELAVTGWETSSGYYNNQGNLNYHYQISQDNYEWIVSSGK